MSFWEVITNGSGQGIDRRSVKGVKSIFRLPISNSLGIEAMEARNKLKNFALQHPPDYTELRGKVYTDVVKAMVETNHDILWELLAAGQTRDKDGVKHQIKVNGVDWSPNLPDQEISRLSNGFSESIMNAFTEIMGQIMPDDYRELAEDKLMNIAKVNGVLGGSGNTRSSTPSVN